MLAREITVRIHWLVYCKLYCSTFFCSERVKSERRAKRRESSQLLQKARSASKERAQVSVASIAEVPPTPQAASSETVEEVVSVSEH